MDRKPDQIDKKNTLGVALSGGGSRAIAFHLGCFRALHDLGYLEKIDHISSVSGGSVFSALYNFIDEPFEAFDDRVVEVLREGLQRKIAKKYFLSSSLLKSLGTTLVSGATAIISKKLGKTPPFVRWYSRTNVFIEVLERDLFSDLTLQSKVKNNYC
ncbi:MAG: patatin-like phospholipase family protein [Candidatus Paceibacterota bacterium]